MWVAIRNAELNATAVVHVDALQHHLHRGWVRVSEPVADKDSLHPADYADVEDLDVKPEPKKPAAVWAKKTEEK